MNDFSKFETRLDAALEALNAGGGASAEAAEKLAAAEASLSEVKQENNNLNAVVKAAEAEKATLTRKLEKARNRVVEFRDKVEALKAEKDGEDEATRNQIAALEQSQQRALELREKARENNRKLKQDMAELRAQNEAMIGDPDKVNDSLKAELAQLKEQRDVDLEEVNGILSRLTPLVEGN